MMNTLCDVPAPPRQCPHESVYENAKHRLVAKRCNKPTLPHGWCSEHVYAHELLEAAAALNYPPYDIAFVFENGQYKPALSVRGMRGSWEAYAVRHPLRRHSELMARLKGEG